MSVMVRYIQRLQELHDQLKDAESQYQTALTRVIAIQQSEGAGQFMYVPAGGTPIQLAVPPETYKTMLDDLTKASVNSAVLHMSNLWRAIGSLSREVEEHIASAGARAGVSPDGMRRVHLQEPQVTTVDAQKSPQLTDTGLAALCDNTPVPAEFTTTVPLPPRVRRIPGGG